MPNINIIESAGLVGTVRSSSTLSGSISSQGNLIGSTHITRVVDDHRLLRNRDAPNQHPISAITDLATELDGKMEENDAMSNSDIESILRRFV